MNCAIYKAFIEEGIEAQVAEIVAGEQSLKLLHDFRRVRMRKYAADVRRVLLVDLSLGFRPVVVGISSDESAPLGPGARVFGDQ